MKENQDCAHCHTELTGSFCHVCGQKQISSRFTVRRLYSDVLASITNLEKGFLHTFKGLIVSPGKVINGYLNGDTVATFKPFRYAFIWATISILISLWLGIFEIQQSQMQSFIQVEQTPEDLARQQQIQGFIGKFLNLLVLSVLPFTSFFSFLFFKKFKKNYAEHLVINTFLLGQATALSILLYPLYYFAADIMTASLLMGTILNAVYFGYGYARVFKVNIFKGALKALLINMFGLILFIISTMILGVIAALAFMLIKKIIG